MTTAELLGLRVGDVVYDHFHTRELTIDDCMIEEISFGGYEFANCVCHSGNSDTKIYRKMYADEYFPNVLNDDGTRRFGFTLQRAEE